MHLLQHGEHHGGLAQLGQEERELRQVRLDALLVPLPRGPLVGPLDARFGAHWRGGGGRAAGGVAAQDAIHVRETELHEQVEDVAWWPRVAELGVAELRVEASSDRSCAAAVRRCGGAARRPLRAGRPGP